jgi:DNA-binding transcriptional ArsR family regulator
MSEPDDELLLDRMIHEPGRLAILTVLSSVKDADFVFLQRTTGLTKGNLSSHLSKLEAAGLVEISKRFIHKKPNTSVALTALGRTRTERHWDQLERLRRLAQTAGGQATAAPAAAEPARRPRAPTVKRARS